MQVPSHPAIVVIDDEPLMGWVMSKVLEKIAPEYVTHTCISGSDALDYIAHHPVCCIITDYLMPHMSGLALAHAVTAQWPEIPIILLTGGRIAAVEAAAQAAGCRIVLEKPVQMETLREVVVPLLAVYRPYDDI